MSDEGSERLDASGRCRSGHVTTAIILLIFQLLQLSYFTSFSQQNLLPTSYHCSFAKDLSLNDEKFFDDGDDDRVPQSADIKKYAIVHLLTKVSPNYLNALLGSAHRLAEFHQQSPAFRHQLDLVVMMPHEADNKTVAALSHPYIKYVFFDPAQILDPIEGKNYRRGTMPKLAPMTLVEYDTLFFLDLDVLVMQPLTSVFQEYRPPAMTYWGTYPSYEFNSGCSLMKPSLGMFNDAIKVLHELWPNKGDNDTATEIAHRVSAKYLQSHPNNLPSATHVASHKGDQAFLHSFYNTVAGTSQKYGPIHPLPHGYCAKSATLNYVTNQMLAGKISLKSSNTPERLGSGGLLHLYGGYGHDGQGNWLHQTRNEQGYNNLFAIHFTVDKPWNNNYFDIQGLDRNVIADTSLRPQERCPSYLPHVDYFTSVVDALKIAHKSPEYGPDWTSQENSVEALETIDLVKACLQPELDELKSLLQQDRASAASSRSTVTSPSYKPLILPPVPE